MSFNIFSHTTASAIDRATGGVSGASPAEPAYKRALEVFSEVPQGAQPDSVYVLSDAPFDAGTVPYALMIDGDQTMENLSSFRLEIGYLPESGAGTGIPDPAGAFVTAIDRFGNVAADVGPPGTAPTGTVNGVYSSSTVDPIPSVPGNVVLKRFLAFRVVGGPTTSANNRFKFRGLFLLAD